jgi:alginate O-acetyltransferase complex protein AlgJ
VIEQVRLPGDKAWRNDPDADVLLLGDSFSNIYSLGDMGWGTSAGLAEQLSFELRRPVERIVKNDNGAFATRQELALALARGDDRLKGKKLVIWQFATRELAVGDWKLTELKLGRKTGPIVPPVNKKGIPITGVVADVSEGPRKGVIYANFVMKFYVKGMKDKDGKPVGEGDGVVHALVIRDHKKTKMAGVKTGDTVRLRIRPWSDVKQRYGTMPSGALEDIMLEVEKDLYWGEPRS